MTLFSWCCRARRSTSYGLRKKRQHQSQLLIIGFQTISDNMEGFPEQKYIRFEKKPCLYSKEVLFTYKRSLVCSANKASF